MELVCSGDKSFLNLFNGTLTIEKNICYYMRIFLWFLDQLCFVGILIYKYMVYQLVIVSLYSNFFYLVGEVILIFFAVWPLIQQYLYFKLCYLNVIIIMAIRKMIEFLIYSFLYNC